MKTIKYLSIATIALIVGVLIFPPQGWAKKKDSAVGHDHAKEHGGTAVQEHGGTTVTASTPAVAEPTPEAIRSSIQGYIETAVQASGSYSITDPATGNVRNLELVRVHERVGKTGGYYYSCTDMKDTANGDLLDLDFDIHESFCYPFFL